MFLQIHFLTSYHASLLNRDEVGLAKRIAFGGAPRMRISSQCQKRHWREWITENTELPSGLRSRHFFNLELKPRLLAEGMEEETAHELIFHLASRILTAAGEKEALDKETLRMKQPVLFGYPEADYLTRLLKEAAAKGNLEAAKAFLDEQTKQGKKNFQEMLRQAGVHNPTVGFEGALFGRFVTSDILARVDAPLHVAHAFTTHVLDNEVDFFTVVDDLTRDEETGAAHAGDMELGAGIFYGYVVVDTPLLISNLTGSDRRAWQEQDPGSARDLLKLLIHAIAQVTPGAKLGATAPYSLADCVILEVGKAQPRSLANAFLKPVQLGLHEANALMQSVEALADYINAQERMYGDTDVKRLVSSLHDWPRSQESNLPLVEIISEGLDYLFGGQP